jgi:hypothetical protein
MAGKRPDVEREWLSLGEVARRLQMSTETARRLVINGTLQAIDVSPDGAARRRWRVKPSSFDLFIAKRMRQSQPDPSPPDEDLGPPPMQGVPRRFRQPASP